MRRSPDQKPDEMGLTAEEISLKFTDVVMGRRSIRGYKPDPVPREVLEEVIELAVRSPSSMNTQPWQLYVLSGDVLDRIREGNTERNLNGVAPSREIRSHGAYAGAHRQRQIEIAIQLFQAMGIERDDADVVRTGYCAVSANGVISKRRPVAEVASFRGFD
jgi:nitroreductase